MCNILFFLIVEEKTYHHNFLVVQQYTYAWCILEKGTLLLSMLFQLIFMCLRVVTEFHFVISGIMVSYKMEG